VGLAGFGKDWFTEGRRKRAIGAHRMVSWVRLGSGYVEPEKEAIGR